ncbi:MAG TPA: VOC family protein [Acetobacteraceae bacterium]|nr:VOC family protein [Acetobacteraceae bacterium]
MLLDLNHIGQIALPVTDVDRAEAFYRTALGLRQLYRFGDLTFFDCAGVRLMLEKTDDPVSAARSSVIYFRCADIVLAVRVLRGRGVIFDDAPHLIARMHDHDLWMSFFRDPDGHTLALMQEAPKGYQPPVV